MKIGILGIGNVLLRDEGLGVRAVQMLEDRYYFPPEVEIIGGGVLGQGLLYYIEDYDRLIVVDAVQGGQEPGTLYRFGVEKIACRRSVNVCMHEEGILEVLTQVEQMDKEIVTTVVGMEPRDVSDWGMSLSLLVESRMVALLESVLEELEACGVSRECLLLRRAA